MAPDKLASAPHSAALRGGTDHGTAAASSEPPGLQRPQMSHPPVGQPEPRTTTSALQIAGAGGKQLTRRDVQQLREGSGKAALTRSSAAWCWNNS